MGARENEENSEKKNEEQMVKEEEEKRKDVERQTMSLCLETEAFEDNN